MDKIKELINALASKSGGRDSSETLELQGVRAFALFMADGRVALWPVEEVAADD